MNKKQQAKVDKSLRHFNYIIVTEKFYKNDTIKKPKYDNFILDDYRNMILNKGKNIRLSELVDYLGLGKKYYDGFSRKRDILFRYTPENNLWVPLTNS